jgi:hypothetical protein
MFVLAPLWMLGMAFAQRGSSPIVLLYDPTSPDLPCPWCRAATHEDDVACTGCGRRFG